MNNKDFILELSQCLRYSTDDTQTMVSNIIEAMIANFQESEPTVMIQGFGTFDVKKKLERVVVNPSTQQRMLVPPKLVLNFKPSVSLKEKFRNGRDDHE